MQHPIPTLRTMARVAASNPAGRLRQLAAAKQKARKLPRGQRLSAMPMAALLGVSWQTLRKWLEEVPGLAESEHVVLGGAGTEYEFEPRGTIALLTAHFEAVAKASKARARRITRAVTGSEPPAGVDDLDIDQLQKIIRTRAMFRAERERENQLCEVAKVERLMRGYHMTLQQALLRSAQEQDPNGSWSPETRRMWDDATDSVLLSLERAGEDFFRQLGRG